jgi:hypothetical protein
VTAVEEIVAHVRSMYTALGDRPRFDAHLDPGILMWESDAEGLLEGLPALDRLRDERRARATGGPAPVSVTPEVVAADAWGDTGVVRYELWARFDGAAPDECFRVTDVLRRGEDGWRIVHHHAERYR